MQRSPRLFDEDDPFAEQPVRPIVRVEDKILESLREQLSKGLLSFAEYESQAKKAVAVLGEEAEQLHKPGSTLRVIFRNQQKQFELNMVTETELVKLRRAAMRNRINSTDGGQVTPTAARRNNAASSTPETSPRGAATEQSEESSSTNNHNLTSSSGANTNSNSSRGSSANVVSANLSTSGEPSLPPKRQLPPQPVPVANRGSAAELSSPPKRQLPTHPLTGSGSGSGIIAVPLARRTVDPPAPPKPEEGGASSLSEIAPSIPAPPAPTARRGSQAQVGSATNSPRQLEDSDPSSPSPRKDAPRRESPRKESPRKMLVHSGPIRQVAPAPGGAAPSPSLASTRSAPSSGMQSPQQGTKSPQQSAKFGASSSTGGLPSPPQVAKGAAAAGSGMQSPPQVPKASSQLSSPPTTPAPQPRRGKNNNGNFQYSPFEVRPEETFKAAAKAVGVAAAISLELECRIIGTTFKERKKYMSVKQYAAYVILVQSRKGSLEFKVTRRYGDFLKCQMRLAEMWPDIVWPRLPRKKDFEDANPEFVERMREPLESFLRIVCSNRDIPRAPAFVEFLDPRLNPTLGQIEQRTVMTSGWVLWKKGVSGFRRFFAVLTRGRLYLFASDKDLDREPLRGLAIELVNCTVYDGGNAGMSVELNFWAIGKRYHLRPTPYRDEILRIWRSLLCNVEADFSHRRVFRLLSVEEAEKILEEQNEALRKASLMLMTKIPSEPSMNRAYYERDKPSNVVIKDSNLKGGTPHKLVEKLLDPNICTPDMVLAFLLTFHSFLPATELLDQLMSYFKKPPAGIKAATRSKEGQLSPEQLRIVVVLQQWITINPRDFVENPNILMYVQGFAMKHKLQRIISLLNKHILKTPLARLSMMPLQAALANMNNNNNNNSNNAAVRDGGGAGVGASSTPNALRSSGVNAAPGTAHLNFGKRLSTRIASGLKRSPRSQFRNPSRPRSSSADRLNPRMNPSIRTHDQLADVAPAEPSARQRVTIEPGGTIRLANAAAAVVANREGRSYSRSRGQIPTFNKPLPKAPAAGSINNNNSNNNNNNNATNSNGGVLSTSVSLNNIFQGRARAGRRKSAELLAPLSSSSQSPAILPDGFPYESWTLFSIHPTEVARQLALHHFSLFQKIKPSEFLNLSWCKENKLQTAPNIVALISAFNVLAGEVSTTVVSVPDVRARAGVIMWWVDVASACFRDNNFSCTMSIVSGLLNSAVYRLRRTWDLIKKDHEMHNVQFGRLSNVMSSEKNYLMLRQCLRVNSPPMLPYLGVFLQDLTFIEDGNRDLLDEKMVNFDKRLRYAKLIQDIILYQGVPYTHEEVPEIQNYFKRFAPPNSEKLFAKSLQNEPRD